ncbi:DUF87 domain-containing protein [Paenibacillus campinasensis]|jgi:hypothetical protein|uniref:DUF87 domain-containing protein n=1 Tax=Paenibacillus campinasensis TaxID=66347 RepID=A0ABW9T1X0_9BACL|nr:ATP-binding protein [Paenibacillus campinasensis]MUG67284.1 DUF87 domain-containing protein [Paenibacillus campinasensis]
MQLLTNSIGVISKVFPHKIVIEIPDTTKINYNFLGDLYICDGINSFVTIHKSFHYKFIYQISSLYEIEKPYDLQEDESKFTNKAYFEALPVGEIQNGEFQYGLSKFPMIGDDVFLTTHNDLSNILQMKNQKWYFTLGSLATHDSFIPKFSIDSLLTTHICILGNTGSGKSTTVRKLLHEIVASAERENIEINDANFIVFDVHDEYESLSNDITSTIYVPEQVSIPLNTLTVEDWINLVQPSSQVQLPVLMNGLRFANLLDDKEQSIFDWIKVYCALELYNNQQSDSVPKRTKIVMLLENVQDDDIQSSITKYNSQFGSFPQGEESKFKDNLKKYIKEKSGYEYEECKYYITDLLKEVSCSTSSLYNLEHGIELTLLLEESKGNNQVRSHCHTLMTRIYNLIATYSKSLFDVDKEKRKRFEEILKFEKGFTKFKVSGLDDNDLLFFTGYLLRTIYKKQRESRQEDLEQKLYHFIFDEAHKYIIENSDNTRSIKIFEQIAKEGRKFGLFMILASQRPGELSKTVLSQCNNFILHRIRNNVDLEQMRKSIPYLSDAQLTRISYLRTGSALLVGEAFTIPMEIIIHGEEYGESSKTTLPSEVWRTKMLDQSQTD